MKKRKKKPCNNGFRVLEFSSDPTVECDINKEIRDRLKKLGYF